MRTSRRRDRRQWRHLYAIPQKFARGYLEFLTIVTRDVVERKRTATELDLVARMGERARSQEVDSVAAE